jgi:hypothetical protein
MGVLDWNSWKVVGYFIHYPQIIHTAFRTAVYLIVMNPARATSFPGGDFSPWVVLIFSLNTCIVKGNRNPASHARHLQRT